MTMSIKQAEKTIAKENKRKAWGENMYSSLCATDNNFYSIDKKLTSIIESKFDDYTSSFISLKTMMVIMENIKIVKFNKKYNKMHSRTTISVDFYAHDTNNNIKKFNPNIYIEGLELLKSIKFLNEYEKVEGTPCKYLVNISLRSIKLCLNRTKQYKTIFDDSPIVTQQFMTNNFLGKDEMLKELSKLKYEINEHNILKDTIQSFLLNICEKYDIKANEVQELWDINKKKVKGE